MNNITYKCYKWWVETEIPLHNIANLSQGTAEERFYATKKWLYDSGYSLKFFKDWVEIDPKTNIR